MKEKYAPRKVFVLENGTYAEITYEELCRREESDSSYADKLFLPLHGMLMEVPENVYAAFYKEQRRQKYIDERSAENGDVSYDALSNDVFNGEDILVDDGKNVDEQVIEQIMLDRLRTALNHLDESEKLLIYALFYDGMTEREYAVKQGVFHNAIHKRKLRILEKLKKIIEN